MKGTLYSIDGKKLKEIELPKIFDEEIREDILKKAYETEKIWQPYAPNISAGKKHSASGIARHLRHVWKSGYGHGRSRIPRKIMWRRGSQFYWVGAEISSAVGGRRAHPPKIENMLRKKKINQKEAEIAFASGIVGSVTNEKIKQRYSKAKEMEVNAPFVIESKIGKAKTKEIVKGINNLLGDLKEIASPEKSVRAGKGKRRNRKYRKSPGLLIVTGSKEELKTKAFEVKKINEICFKDLYPLGRLAIYTEDAIAELGGKE